MSADDLQRQCQELLSKLKMNQTSLRQGMIPVAVTNSLENNLQGKPVGKPEYARQKLKSIMRSGPASSSRNPVTNGIPASSASQRVEVGYGELSNSAAPYSQDRSRSEEKSRGRDRSKDRDRSRSHERLRLAQGQETMSGRNDEREALPYHDAMHEYFQSRVTDSLMEDGTDSVVGVTSADDNARPVPNAKPKPTTPVSVRRRRIIDRNVHVDSKLSAAELKELERGTYGLNFSYSDADETLLKSKQPEDQGAGDATPSKPEDLGYTYTKNLVDDGNNRRLNNFVKEATIKPKTILNSTQSYSSRSGRDLNTSSHSAGNSTSNSSLFRNQEKDRRLLGYDWIAALVDNDLGVMEESESYFNELREFRRCNRDECCNDFYMESPFTLAETEPPEVDKAINETKVQPYTVNERLFTEPITENLLGEPMVPGGTESQKEEPTNDNPRFVRVSVPRSTLLVPYRVRPHRRRSFDDSDSCSLMSHCLLGWNAVSPATLPTASSVSLTNAIGGTNPKHTTTLAEAERVAATFQWPLLTDPRPKVDPLPTWRKEYMDTTVNFPHPDMSLSLSSSLTGSARQQPGSTRQKTNDLLKKTYSMMYEMQRTREKRNDERNRQVGESFS